MYLLRDWKKQNVKKSVFVSLMWYGLYEEIMHHLFYFNILLFYCV